MGGKKGKRSHAIAPRRARRSGRRAAVSHSAIATIFGVGIALTPLVAAYGGSGSPMAAFQGGNWALGLQLLSSNLTSNWALYLFALVPVILIALVAKKFASKMRISKHWTV